MNSDDRVFIQYSPLVTSFPCQRLSNYSALCITPMFNTTCDIEFNLIIKDSNDEIQQHQGIYTICEFFVERWGLKGQTKTFGLDESIICSDE